MSSVSYKLDDLKFTEDGDIQRAVFIVDQKEIYIVSDFRIDDEDTVAYDLSVGKVDGDALVFYKEIEPRHEEVIEVILEDIMEKWGA